MEELTARLRRLEHDFDGHGGHTDICPGCNGREAADALETLEWFAEHAYSLVDRERARKALGL